MPEFCVYKIFKIYFVLNVMLHGFTSDLLYKSKKFPSMKKKTTTFYVINDS